MKKLFKAFGLMSMAALLAVSTSSCKKTEDEGAEFIVGLSQVGGLSLEDRAYIDVYDGSMLKWNNGDKIRVYNLDNDYTQSVSRVFTAVPGSEGKTSTRFKGTAVGAKKGIGYFYFYPAEMVQSQQGVGKLGEDNRETFNVPATQTYNKEVMQNIFVDTKSLVMACEVNAISDDFQMQHIFGILNVNLTKGSAARIKSIVVRDKAFHLAGTVSMKLPEVNSAMLSGFMQEIAAGNTPSGLAGYLQTLGYEANGDSYTLTLDLSKADNNQGVLLNGTRKYFFIPIRPGALYRGFDIIINYMDSSLEPTVIPYDPDTRWCTQPALFTNIPISI